MRKFGRKQACHPSSHTLRQSDAVNELADVHIRMKQVSLSLALSLSISLGRLAHLNQGQKRKRALSSHSLLSPHLPTIFAFLTRGRAIVKREMIHSAERPGAICRAGRQVQDQPTTDVSVVGSVGRTNGRPLHRRLVEFYIVNPNGTNDSRLAAAACLSVCLSRSNSPNPLYC